MDPNKQQIVERLKQATNILVTVSANPSIDQLASCIGITLFLNKLGKHATAVFSGEAPSTIEFLQPEATLEKNTNSLRDFIIALDKAKADKLRYKVEENVVKIFITPYRTSLSQDDLNFSQGDFNVEAVLALGVNEREDLDRAIVAHGRILHDATVMSVNAGPSGGLGSINWSDPNASSLSEMLTSMLDDLKKGQLDNQIATALLTGIVAETNRFSNEKTSPQAMSQAAVLMSAGANQQLIATKLQEPQNIPDTTTQEEPSSTAETSQPAEETGDDVVSSDGTLSINHYEDEHHDDQQENNVEEAPLDYSIHDKDESESDLPNIHIDDGGNFKPLDEETFENNQPQAENPQQENELQEGERLPMATEPPQNGGQLNASDMGETSESEGEDAVDPLTSPAQLESLLQHDAGSNAMQYEPAPMPPSAPNPAVGEVAEPTAVAAPEETTSLPDLTSIIPSSAPDSEEPVLPPLPLEPEHTDDASTMPEVDNAATAAHQEMVLQPLTPSNEPLQPPTDDASVDYQTLDSARSAVENALNAGDNLEPVQGLGTTPLSNGSLHEEPTPIGDILAQSEQQPSVDEPVGGVIDPTKAPEVPPPLLPPLPPIQTDETPPTNPLFNQS